MSDFTPITTQEQLDQIIGQRVERAKSSTLKEFQSSEEYTGMVSRLADQDKQISDMTRAAEELAKKYEGYDKTLADLQGKVKAYETRSVKSRIAHEVGIPYELIDRLNGETEEDIKADAESLKKLVTPQRPAPMRDPEPAGNGDTTKAAFRQLAHSLNN